ncbi:MAG: hypothetical protein RR706_01535 [Muribaculaceae bacterium]
MKQLISIVLMLLPFMGIATNTVKNWSDGPLSWNDFQGTTVIQDMPSYLKTILEVKPKHVITKGKTHISMEAIAQMDCNLSFANADKCTEQLLRYNQLQFDLLEFYRRRLQTDLNTGMTGIDADKRVKDYKEQYNTQIDAIAKQTIKGSDDHKLQEWEYYVRRQLDELQRPPIPEIIPGAFSYGLYFGTGALFPTSGIDNAFGNSWSFTAGLGLGYNRIKLNADISYGQPRIINQNVLGIENQMAIGTYSSYLAVAVTLGYSVFETKHFSITPRVGGYYSSYGWNVGNYEPDAANNLKLKNTESPEISDFNWYAAIDFDYHFHTVVGKSPFFLTGHREQYTSTLRFTPFIGRAIYDKPMPRLRGCQIGFTVSYAGIARSLGIK